ncbi:pentapeptide repeat-containing protein [Methylobacterium oryzihabitans]|uniref:Pentapeptide repeat-containing protein n=1 Tax=Methylobacterium oryzihabitans TaxID=2499852 RepID=A0A3S2WEY7_9HYPH|nr:pentapeptide repeat-containing protein [Methylobacterium oryzihabitans]RVU20769.1 pentapeptide repeat-containing protein [Methylobacterium oryzihabitans]
MRQDQDDAGVAADPRLSAFLAVLARSAGRPLRGDGPFDLRGVRAGRADLAPHAGAGDPPPWLDEAGGLNLAEAGLAGADLIEADLSGANLARASLAGVLGRSARFAGARIEEADFAEADLSGADFTGIVGGQARFADAMVEDATFADAAMRFAKLPRALLDGADFSRADLWGADFAGADADYSVFRGARLDEADLSDTNLTHADFEGASLKKAKLVNARLRGANLTGLKLDGADLSGADLSDTNLVRLDLATCNLRHVRFAGAWLTGTRFRVEQLGGAVGEEVAGEYEAAKASYLALEQNLRSIGSHEESRWAYKRGRRMGRRHAFVQARAAWRGRDARAAVSHGYRWVSDRFVEWLCDYGESLSRLVRAFAVVIALFAVLYGATGGLLLEEDGLRPTYNVLDLVSYSALNMMTANPPEIGIKPVGRVTNLLVGAQGAAGIILMGLFGFVLGNRLRR